MPADVLSHAVTEVRIRTALIQPHVPIPIHRYKQNLRMQSYNDAITMNGSLYAAEGYSHLMAIDSLNIMYCNEDMMTDKGLEKPYSLVRDGAWTLEALHTYLKEAASMNSDTTFDWTTGGTAVYGISLADASQGIPFMLFGADERLLEMQDNALTLTAGSERYYAVVSKLASILTKANGNTYYGICNSDDGDDGHWIYAFEHERAMFMVTELCKPDGCATRTTPTGSCRCRNSTKHRKSIIPQPSTAIL